MKQAKIEKYIAARRKDNMNTNTVSLPATLELNIDLTDEQFFQLCQNNRDLRFERTATGELIIMPPTGSETSDRNAELTYQLRAWSRQNQLGKSFDSSGGFKLPNDAERSPDASWVKMERWNALSVAEKERFAPLCPDFVVELMSPSDSTEKTRAKMREYMDNGARLGWLINRQQQQVEIYRPHREVEILSSPKTLSGEDILPGFVLDLAQIW
jgi:Uma2 family endonuclease